MSFSSYSDRLTKSKIKSLQYRRSAFDLHLLYKIVNNLSDLQFSDYFTFKSTNYNIRGKSTKIYTKQKTKNKKTKKQKNKKQKNKKTKKQKNKKTTKKKKQKTKKQKNKKTKKQKTKKNKKTKNQKS